MCVCFFAMKNIKKQSTLFVTVINQIPSNIFYNSNWPTQSSWIESWHFRSCVSLSHPIMFSRCFSSEVHSQHWEERGKKNMEIWRLPKKKTHSKIMIHDNFNNHTELFTSNEEKTLHLLWSISVHWKCSHTSDILNNFHQKKNSRFENRRSVVATFLLFWRSWWCV